MSGEGTPNENTYWAKSCSNILPPFLLLFMSGPIKLSLWAGFTVFIFSHLSASNQFWDSCSARVWWLRGKSLASQATPRQQQPFFSPCCALPSSRIISFPFPDPLSLPLWWTPTQSSKSNSNTHLSYRNTSFHLLL